MKIKKQNIPFTQIANEVLYRQDISFQVKGLFAYLFSKPDGWDFSSDRIALESQEDRKTVQRILKKMEVANLLKRKRLPSGRMEYTIEYADSQSPKMGLGVTEPKSHNASEAFAPRGEMGPISNKDKESNKDIAEASSARSEMRKKKAEESNKMIKEYNFGDYLKRMEDHKARHIQVIAFYFKKKKINFDTLQKAQAAIRRHLRAAKEVSNFSDDEIVGAYKVADKEYPSMYTCETLLKILTR